MDNKNRIALNILSLRTAFGETQEKLGAALGEKGKTTISNYENGSRQWDYIKNGYLDPTEISGSSKKKVWWHCNKGHDWEAVIANRVKKNTGCPICIGRKVLSGYNDLATKRPDLAKEWNYIKNNPLTPDQVVAGSHKKVWWKCSKEHEWLSAVYNRATDNHGCPFCSEKRAKPVECIDTGVIYKSCYEATKQTGIQSIGMCCNGQRNMAGGYHWRFAE